MSIETIQQNWKHLLSLVENGALSEDDAYDKLGDMLHDAGVSHEEWEQS